MKPSGRQDSKTFRDAPVSLFMVDILACFQSNRCALVHRTLGLHLILHAAEPWPLPPPRRSTASGGVLSTARALTARRRANGKSQRGGPAAALHRVRRLESAPLYALLPEERVLVTPDPITQLLLERLPYETHHVRQRL